MSPELSVELRPPLKSPGDVAVTSSSGRSTRSEFSRIWWKREKIAVFAPIPSATESTTVRLSRGAFARLRQAKRSRASPLNPPRRAKGDLLFYEQRYRHANPDGDDDPPHRRAPHSARRTRPADSAQNRHRSEEHTSELQSLRHLVCRLLFVKRAPPTKPTPLPLHPPLQLLGDRPPPPPRAPLSAPRPRPADSAQNRH